MVRFAGLSRFAAALLVLLGFANAVAAQEHRDTTTDAVIASAGAEAFPAEPAQSAASVAPVPPPSATPTAARPAALVPLYASFVALQILDVHSTKYALARGAVEANPAVKGLVGSTVGMAVVKAAGTAGVIFVSEKLRTKNRAAAIGLMIAANSAMTWVVQHNYRIAR